MKAWSWFAIPLLALVAAYAATPVLVASLTGHDAEAVVIAQLDLPDDAVKPATKPAAGREIDYSVFGGFGNTSIPKPKPVVVEPTLQSILMTAEGGVAVVDGNMVREGNQVGAYRVVKIEPRAVMLAITRITSTRTGKRITREQKEELKVLHFPEYREADMPATSPAAAHGQKLERAELEQKYKKVLEQLK